MNFKFCCMLHLFLVLKHNMTQCVLVEWKCSPNSVNVHIFATDNQHWIQQSKEVNSTNQAICSVKQIISIILWTLF